MWLKLVNGRVFDMDGAQEAHPVDQYWMTMGMRYRGARRPRRE